MMKGHGYTCTRYRIGVGFIMNGHIVVGVGNIYASEALFMAGIHPQRAAGRVSLQRYEGLVARVSEDDADVIAALTALGFSIVEAQRALQQLDRDSAMSLDEKIRQALTYLGQ